MCLQGMMGRMEEKIAIDAKTIESALAHCGANLENQNTALISENTRRMIFGPEGFQEYIWFKGKEIFCTGCGGAIDPSEHHFTHNQPTRCPICGCGVIAKNAKLGHKKLEQEFYTVEWRKSTIEKDAIVMIGIYCGADYRRAERIKKTVVPILVDVFRYGKSAERFQRAVWSFGKPAGEAEWHKRRDVRSLGYAYFGHPYDVLQSQRNFDLTIAGTPFESAYKTMLKVEETRIYHTGERSELMSAIARRPWMEYMAKAGFSNIAFAAEGSLPRGMFNTKRSNIREIMKLSKDRYAEIKGKHLDIDIPMLDIIQRGDTGGAKLKLEEAEKLSRLLGSEWMRKELLHGRKLDRTLARYLLRMNPQDITDLRDYWNMAVRNGIDLKNPDNYLPKDLHREHDRLVQIERDAAIARNNEYRRKQAQRQAEIALSNQEKLEKRLKKLESKYYFEARGLILRPARSGIELVNEGSALNHCVGSYIQSYAEGRTDICFLRKADAPDTPWRTIEIDPNSGRVIQDRGYGNDRNSYGHGLYSTLTDDLKKLLEDFWAEFHKAKELREAV